MVNEEWILDGWMDDNVQNPILIRGVSHCGLAIYIKK
jgi:hypothetical protein